MKVKERRSKRFWMIVNLVGVAFWVYDLSLLAGSLLLFCVAGALFVVQGSRALCLAHALYVDRETT